TRERRRQGWQDSRRPDADHDWRQAGRIAAPLPTAGRAHRRDPARDRRGVRADGTPITFGFVLPSTALAKAPRWFRFARHHLAKAPLGFVLPERGTHTPFVPAKAGTQEPHAVSFYVYILASGRNGTLYTGMTDDLVRRVWQHRTGAVPGFASE